MSKQLIISVRCNNGEELNLTQFNGEHWQLSLKDAYMITALEAYDLVRDIFDKKIAKDTACDIKKITLFIDDNFKLTVKKDTTREEFLCRLIARKPIFELFN